jgi:hypothetical protein
MVTLGGVTDSIADARIHVDNVPGLYAIHGDPFVWRYLKLDPRQPGIPLYVGKSEGSLVTRELKTHFAVDRRESSKTGGSTVRRSFAALLHHRLSLRGVPRNKNKPGYFDKYALEPDGDVRLTDWMHENLRIAVWPKPIGLSLRLKDIEFRILRTWQPPINLADVPVPLKYLTEARARMALEARTWASTRGESFS